MRPDDPTDAFERALDGAAAAVAAASIGLELLRRQLDGVDRGDRHAVVLANLRTAADRERDEVRTMTEVADAVLGARDTVVRLG